MFSAQANRCPDPDPGERKRGDVRVWFLSRVLEPSAEHRTPAGGAARQARRHCVWRLRWRRTLRHPSCSLRCQHLSQRPQPRVLPMAAAQLQTQQGGEQSQSLQSGWQGVHPGTFKAGAACTDEGNICRSCGDEPACLSSGLSGCVQGPPAPPGASLWREPTYSALLRLLQRWWPWHRCGGESFPQPRIPSEEPMLCEFCAQRGSQQRYDVCEVHTP